MPPRRTNVEDAFEIARVPGPTHGIARAQTERILLDAIARERIDLAGALHDGLGQELFGIALLAKSLTNRPNIDADDIRADLARLATLSSHAIKTCREVAHGLSPLTDADGGLVEALRRLTIMPGDWPGPTITFAVLASDPLLLSVESITHIYRLAQEGITNAIKHANARRIRMVLDTQSHLLTLTISDDGIGMPAKTMGNESSLGIKMMRYRATLLRGVLRLHQRRHGGTRLVLECAQGA